MYHTAYRYPGKISETKLTLCQIASLWEKKAVIVVSDHGHLNYARIGKVFGENQVKQSNLDFEGG